MHFACPDFDLCAACEAHPIPVHPPTHPLLKIRTIDTVIPAVVRRQEPNHSLSPLPAEPSLVTPTFTGQNGRRPLPTAFPASQRDRVPAAPMIPVPPLPPTTPFDVFTWPTVERFGEPFPDLPGMSLSVTPPPTSQAPIGHGLRNVLSWDSRPQDVETQTFAENVMGNATAPPASSTATQLTSTVPMLSSFPGLSCYLPSYGLEKVAPHEEEELLSLMEEEIHDIWDMRWWARRVVSPPPVAGAVNLFMTTPRAPSPLSILRSPTPSIRAPSPIYYSRSPTPSIRAPSPEPQAQPPRSTSPTPLPMSPVTFAVPTTRPIPSLPRVSRPIVVSIPSPEPLIELEASKGDMGELEDVSDSRSTAKPASSGFMAEVEATTEKLVEILKLGRRLPTPPTKLPVFSESSKEGSETDEDEVRPMSLGVAGSQPPLLPMVDRTDFDGMFDIKSRFQHLLDHVSVFPPAQQVEKAKEAEEEVPTVSPPVVTAQATPAPESANERGEGDSPLALEPLLSRIATPLRSTLPGRLSDLLTDSRRTSTVKGGSILSRSNTSRPSSLATDSRPTSLFTDDASTIVAEITAHEPLRAAFVADNNIPDGTVFPPGAEFVKSWRMRNNGPRAWPATTELVFVAGDRMHPDGKLHEQSRAREQEGTRFKVGSVDVGEEVDVWTGDLKVRPSPGFSPDAER